MEFEYLLSLYCFEIEKNIMYNLYLYKFGFAIIIKKMLSSLWNFPERACKKCRQ